jgi:hypothetical protein
MEGRRVDEIERQPDCDTADGHASDDRPVQLQLLVDLVSSNVDAEQKVPIDLEDHATCDQERDLREPFADVEPHDLPGTAPGPRVNHGVVSESEPIEQRVLRVREEPGRYPTRQFDCYWRQERQNCQCENCPIPGRGEGK